MKSTVMKFVFIAGCMLAFSLNAHAQKIGYTNVEIILASMPEAIKANKDVEAFAKVLNERLGTKDAYLQSKYEEYQEAVGSNKLSPEQKQIAENELNKLQQELQTSAKEADDKIMGKQQELMNPLLEKVQTAIDAVAKEGGYTYILNQTSGSNILYGLETLDVTKTIAQKLGISLPPETVKKP